ncbi:MAG: pilus assembly protein [Altererythrobacter sp.]
MTAKATRSLPFSSLVMGNNSVTISVRAQASFKDGEEHNACLVALASESGVLDIGGNATVKAKCGLAALSCEEDAITIDGSATVDTDSIATCGTATVPTANEDELTEGVQGLEDIYGGLTPPDNPTSREYECEKFGTGNKKYEAATLQPGTYSDIVVKCETVLQSGIYVIDGGVLDLAGNYNVTGTNVMFVLKNGAYLKWGGSGNGNKINLTPMQESDFLGTSYADKADQYAGILVFEHRDNVPKDKDGNPDYSNRPTHTLNGNSNSIIEGLMYMPTGLVKILGTADIAAQCLQISAWKIKVTGNANLETLCPVDETMSVGHSIPEVRLVA